MMERPRLELREREEQPGDWKEVRTWLVRALKEMPEARARLIEVLERGVQKKGGK